MTVVITTEVTTQPKKSKFLRKICKERLGAKAVSTVPAGGRDSILLLIISYVANSNQALLLLHSIGNEATKTGIVVTAGAITTAVIPVIEGVVINDTIETFPVAEGTRKNKSNRTCR